jgi:hypothetical protein
LESPLPETASLKYGRTGDRAVLTVANASRASKPAAITVLAMLLVQSVAFAAAAAPAASASPVAGPLALAPPVGMSVEEPVPVRLNPAGEPLTPEQAAARLAAPEVVTPGDGVDAWAEPPVPPTRSDLDRTPLADTDNNDAAQARWINSTDTQFLGENINGASTGSPARRTDVDWWRFRLGFSAVSADTITFDIEKDNWDHVEVYVYTWPDADPDGNSRLVRYDYMNASQNWGEKTTVTLTAFEGNDYVMLIQTLFRRNLCCVVNYTINNIQFGTATPEDDNNNITRSEAMTVSALPTNREVDQAADWYDVYDLTSLFTIDKTRGDDAQVNVGITVNAGRNGTSDVYNGTSGGADDDIVLSYGIFTLIYRDHANYWWSLPTTLLAPGQSGSVQGLVNGTPAYIVVSVNAQLTRTAVQSSVPGWIQYTFNSWNLQEDHAPVKVADVPTLSMLEDNPASGVGIVDLASYFTDDIDAGALWFTVSYKQFAFVDATVNGTSLTVRVNQQEWSGSVTLRVLAHDLGWDRTASLDDHTTQSNYFPVQVQPVNDAPRILSYGGLPVTGGALDFTVSQGQTLTLGGVATDPEDNASLVWAVSQALPNATFNPGNGQLVMDPSNGDVGNYTVVVSVRDPSFANMTVTVNIHVVNVNDPPRFTVVGGLAVGGLDPLVFDATQGQPFALTVRIDDPDFTIGVPSTFNFASNRSFFGPLNVTVSPTDPREATYTFTPTNAQVGALGVRLSVGDGPVGVFQDNVTVTIQVANVNDGPVFTHVGTTTGVYPLTSKTAQFLGLDGAIQGRDFVLTVRADDLDVALGLGDALVFETDMPGSVTVSINPGGLSADLLYIPSQADAAAGQVVFHVFVNDSLAPVRGDELTVVIDITNVNDDPVLTPVVSLTLDQDEPFSYMFEAVDPDGDMVTFSSDSPLFPVDSSTGSIDFTPNNADIGGADKIFEVTITAFDGKGGSASIRVTVIIKNVNDPPSALEIQSPVSGQSFAAGEDVVLVGSATDIDKDEAGTLVYSWFVDGTKVGDGKTVTATLSNEDTAPRTVEVRMQVTDAKGGSSNQTITVTVQGKVEEGGPGFEGPAVVVAVIAIAGLAAVGGRGRRRL